jgi:catalase
VSTDALKPLGPDFLENDLKQKLARGPLVWRLVVTLAARGDPSNDATRAWPPDRKQIEVGTLTVRRAEDEADGPCRDYNYDPTILPVGIEVSDDPLLAARSAAYARSFDLRTAEAAHYPRTPLHTGGAP